MTPAGDRAVAPLFRSLALYKIEQFLPLLPLRLDDLLREVLHLVMLGMIDDELRHLDRAEMMMRHLLRERLVEVR